MLPYRYQQAAMRTLSSQQNALDRIRKGLGGPHPMACRPLALVQLLHASMGLAGEAGELSTNIQKHIWYGKPLDIINIKEELGDLMWFIAEMCDAAGLNLAEVMDTNIAKLEARYPEKFTEFLADEENRDRDAERRILESGRCPVPPIEIVNTGAVPQAYPGVEPPKIDREKMAELQTARTIARENSFMCPNCKTPVNDEIVRKLHLGEYRTKVFLCCGCQQPLAKDSIIKVGT